MSFATKSYLIFLPLHAFHYTHGVMGHLFFNRIYMNHLLVEWCWRFIQFTQKLPFCSVRIIFCFKKHWSRWKGTSSFHFFFFKLKHYMGMELSPNITKNWRVNTKNSQRKPTTISAKSAQTVKKLYCNSPVTNLLVCVCNQHKVSIPFYD